MVEWAAPIPQFTMSPAPVPPDAGAALAGAPTVPAGGALAAARGVITWLVVGNLIALLLGAVLPGLSLLASREAFERRALDASDNLAHLVQASITAQIDRIDLGLQTVVQAHARQLEAAVFDAAELTRIITEQRALLSEVDSLGTTDDTGHVRFGWGAAAARSLDLSGRDFYQAARQVAGARLVVSEPFFTRISKKWVVVLARRLAHPDGRFAGVAYATVTAEHFDRLIAEVDVGERGAVALRSGQLRLLARRTGSHPGAKPEELGDNRVSTELQTALRQSPRMGTYVARTALDQIERANAYRNLERYPFFVLVGLATDEYLAPWRAEAVQVGGLSLLVMVMLVVSSVVFYRSWQRERRIAQALIQEGDRHRAFLHAASDGIHVLDRDGRVVEVNEAFADSLRRRQEDMIGLHVSQWDDAFEKEDLAHFLRDFKLGEQVKFSTTHRRLDGSSFEVEVACAAVRIGQRDLLFCSSRDVSERLRRQAELQREQALRQLTERHVEELDALLRERSEMLDVLAHEVRQPLNNASAALQSAAAAMAEAGDTVAATRLRRAQDVTGHVLASIDNTLAVASLLARPEPIQREDADIDTLLAVVIADMPVGERARIKVQRESTTRTASMDMSLMRLALRNLLSNALKYSPPHSEVLLRLLDWDEPLALVIEVSDRGPGVAAGLEERLFERGVRGDHAGGPSGHGLGLYIVRRVMELHGGRVELVPGASPGATLRMVVAQSPED